MRYVFRMYNPFQHAPPFLFVMVILRQRLPGHATALHIFLLSMAYASPCWHCSLRSFQQPALEPWRHCVAQQSHSYPMGMVVPTIMVAVDQPLNCKSKIGWIHGLVRCPSISRKRSLSTPWSTNRLRLLAWTSLPRRRLRTPLLTWCHFPTNMASQHIHLAGVAAL